VRELSLDDAGDDVLQLQDGLKGLGFVSAAEAFVRGVGYFPDLAQEFAQETKEQRFGHATERVVNIFRATFGWNRHGRATRNTRCALDGQVRALQRKLGALDCYRGPQHGRFDVDTRAALERFQKGDELPLTGRLDAATRERLAATPPFTDNEVLCRELDDVLKARWGLGQPVDDNAAGGGNAVVRAHQARLLGLAFSGGGIRSATFNLGVLQALARLGLLRHVDYLSTVSGGGYIGAWLHAWVHRAGGIAAVEAALAPAQGAAAREPGPVSWLRQYSNYLTPRVGLLSADTMTGVATWMRNVLLNQVILAALGLALLCLPWLLLWVLHRALAQGGGWPGVVAWLGLALVALGGYLGGRETALIESGEAFPDGRPGAPQPATEGCRQATETASPRRAAAMAVVVAAALGSLLAGIALPLAAQDQRALLAAFWLAHAIPFSAGWMAAGGNRSKSGWSPVLAALGASVPIAVAAAGLMAISTEMFHAGQGLLLLIVLGPAGALMALLLAVTVHTGLSGRGLRESSREWWSRCGGILLSVLLGWLALAGLGLLAAYGVQYTGEQIAALGGVAWLITTVAGVVAGRSPGTQGGGGGWKELLARVAPWVFVAGLLVFLSWGLHQAIVRAGGTHAVEVCPPGIAAQDRKPAYEFRGEVPFAAAGGTSGIASGQVSTVEQKAGCRVEIFARQARGALEKYDHLWLWPVALLLLAWILGRRVDINVFSFHQFYRNRIERCYLGASVEGPRGHPFTGLDSRDSPKLAKLTLDRTPEGPGQRPYPLINAALNLTRCGNLAWQERKAASFLFTPRFCGYQLPEAAGGELSSYQWTADYVARIKDGTGKQSRKDSPVGWIALGMPVTVSGAAASPNAGYHTSPATAFLMTVFNVRLGWWIQNTRNRRHWASPGPRQSIKYLLKELLASTSAADDFVYVSDGGHFENLGVYELVRRRCRYIIVCDAGCDPDYSFEDLGNALRKCGTDFGIEIEIDPHAIIPDPQGGRSRFHCAVGTIHYERVDPVAAPGYLLYIKASLTGDEPADVLQYKAAHARFPHESTGDQWYSESQFEAYRKLGQYVAGEVLGRACEDAGQAAPAGLRADAGRRVYDRERLFHSLSEQWYPPGRAPKASFATRGKDLERMYESLRGDSRLRFLDAQIYPEWLDLAARGPVQGRPTLEPMFPPTQEELRAGFYFCTGLIQLMENVYHDLNLEQEHEHPDNRGWMNLFRHWSWSGMLRVTWSVSAATYGARFQQFCRRELGLQVGEVVAGDPVEIGTGGWRDRLNFVECDHVCRIAAGTADVGCRAGYGLYVAPMELLVSDPMGKVQDFRFHFGFALLELPVDGSGKLELMPLPAKSPRLVYYRVQDHLRNMGMGRAGLGAVIRRYPKLGIQLPPRLEELIAEVEVDRMNRLWYSVLWASSGGQAPRA
jgi:hypothetical protein